MAVVEEAGEVRFLTSKTMEAKLGKPLDELIKAAKKDKGAGKKNKEAASDKAAQVKKRSQSLRANKVGKARGMDVDMAPVPVVKPTVKKQGAKKTRPAKANKKAADKKPAAKDIKSPKALIVQVAARPSPSPTTQRAQKNSSQKGIRIRQPTPGARKTQPNAGGGKAKAGAIVKRRTSGQRVVKPAKPTAPVKIFGSPSANKALIAAKARGITIHPKKSKAKRGGK